MRLGVVRGSVVLSLAAPGLEGTRMVIVEPVSAERLTAGGELGGGKPLIAADQLGPAVGEVVGFVEGRTAASPYYPVDAPVDAYCVLIAENIEYHPPKNEDLAEEEVRS
jgi:microcompartment protein CcmK/EutM